jgi:hypothetical protein
MERTKLIPGLLWYEVIGFGILIAIYWLVELPIVPTLILGADAQAAWDRIESPLLTTAVLVFAGPALFRTRRLALRVDYLEQLLRMDPWSRRLDAGKRDVILATLGDGNQTIAWRFSPDDWVQSTLHPEIAGRIVSGRICRSLGDPLREEYELELDGGSRFPVEGSQLRHLPLCDGRPMRFVYTMRSLRGSPILVYQCPDCDVRTELLL